MCEQGSGRGRLDVTRVRADGKHGLLPGGQPCRPPASHQRSGSGLQPIRPDRLLQELIGLFPQLPHGDIGGLVRGDHGDGKVRGEPAQRRQELQAGHARQFRVSQYQVPGR